MYPKQSCATAIIHHREDQLRVMSLGVLGKEQTPKPFQPPASCVPSGLPVSNSVQLDKPVGSI